MTDTLDLLFGHTDMALLYGNGPMFMGKEGAEGTQQQHGLIGSTTRTFISVPSSRTVTWATPSGGTNAYITSVGHGLVHEDLVTLSTTGIFPTVNGWDNSSSVYYGSTLSTPGFEYVVIIDGIGLSAPDDQFKLSTPTLWASGSGFPLDGFGTGVHSFHSQRTVTNLLTILPNNDTVLTNEITFLSTLGEAVAIANNDTVLTTSILANTLAVNNVASILAAKTLLTISITEALEEPAIKDTTPALSIIDSTDTYVEPRIETEVI